MKKISNYPIEINISIFAKVHDEGLPKGYFKIKSKKTGFVLNGLPSIHPKHKF